MSFRKYAVCLILPLLAAAPGTLLGQAFTDPAASREIPAFTVPAAKPDVAYQRFMVIGDMGTGRSDQRTVAAGMAARAKTDGLDFVLTVGDNFYEFGVSSVDDPQWKDKFEDIYAAPSLQVPFFASLGNHDRLGNAAAQIEYARRNARWKMPDYHYTFQRRLVNSSEVAFFALDTDLIHRAEPDWEQQVAWLARELRRSDARWKLVYGHHPLYGHNPRRGHNQPLIDKLEPVFVENRVDVYFAGHDHTLEMLKPIRGVHYVISGGAAGEDKAYPVEWNDECYYAATGGGFVLCRISPDELVVEFVRPDGRTQFAHTLTKPPRR